MVIQFTRFKTNLAFSKECYLKSTTSLDCVMMSFYSSSIVNVKHNLTFIIITLIHKNVYEFWTPNQINSTFLSCWMLFTWISTHFMYRLSSIVTHGARKWKIKWHISAQSLLWEILRHVIIQILGTTERLPNTKQMCECYFWLKKQIECASRCLKWPTTDLVIWNIQVLSSLEEKSVSVRKPRPVAVWPKCNIRSENEGRKWKIEITLCVFLKPWGSVGIILCREQCVTRANGLGRVNLHQIC